MGYMVSRDDGWRMPDWLWERIESLLPPRPFHPLGCHRPRVPDRDAMEAILTRRGDGALLLRTRSELAYSRRGRAARARRRRANRL
jgi:hypothetical protein